MKNLENSNYNSIDMKLSAKRDGKQYSFAWTI